MFPVKQVKQIWLKVECVKQKRFAIRGQYWGASPFTVTLYDYHSELLKCVMNSVNAEIMLLLCLLSSAP